MGGAYAMHLVAAGFEVWVLDPSPQATAAAVDNGCTDAASMVRLWRAEPAVIVLSLASQAAFDEVVADLAALARAEVAVSGGAPVVVDTSTLPLDAKQHARQLLAGSALELLDCPVSGTGRQALERDLVVYASGDKSALERAQPVLDALSDRVRHLGEFGLGTQVKLLANLLVGIHNTAAAEMLALAERAGLDPEWALGIVLDGAGQSRMLEQRGPSMARGEYGYGASVDLFCKDLAIIDRYARQAGARTPLLDRVVELYNEAAERGLGAEESAAVHAVYVDRLTAGDVDRHRS
jgi:putative dehydrogenase